MMGPDQESGGLAVILPIAVLPWVSDTATLDHRASSLQSVGQIKHVNRRDRATQGEHCHRMEQNSGWRWYLGLAPPGGSVYTSSYGDSKGPVYLSLAQRWDKMASISRLLFLRAR